jgi:hypothetical protein
MPFNYERGAFWVTLIGLPLAIALTFVSMQHDWTLAQATGALRKPQLQVALAGGLPLDPLTETRLLIGAREITQGRTVVVAGIPFLITNLGNATLENTTITFRSHRMLRRDAFEHLKFVFAGGFEASQIQRSFTESGELEYSSYMIPALNPGETLAGSEPLYLFKTDTAFTVPVQASKGRRMTASVNVGFGLTFLLTVTAKDVQIRDYPMEFESIQSTSLDDLTQRATTTKILPQLLERRRQSTFGQYLKALTFGVPDETIYLVFTELDEHPVDNGILYVGRPNPQIRRVSYEPVSWRLLFRQ